MTLLVGLGFDLAIKTGALAQVWVEDEYKAIEKIKILYSYDKGPSIKDDLQYICDYFDSYILYKLTVGIVGHDRTMYVDWNINEIYWAANKTNSSVKTFMAGYILRHCHNQHIGVEFTSPKQIRDNLGFTQKAHKFEVQREFLTRIPTINKAAKEITKLNDHELDAVILAYYSAYHGVAN